MENDCIYKIFPNVLLQSLFFNIFQHVQVMENDCIYKIVLLHFLKEKLQETKLSYGEQLFCQAMETMDPTVAKQLMTLIS